MTVSVLGPQVMAKLKQEGLRWTNRGV